MIGTPEAQYISNKESGVGFLRVGMEDPVKFQSVYTGNPYVPVVTAAGDDDAPRAQADKTLRIHRFTAAPIMDATVAQ